jgi:hypothetical protein
MFAHILAIVVAATLLGDRLLAQEVSGSLRGRVVGPSGEPAPDVRISVSGRDLLGARTVTTDRDGFFHVLALPPGEYTARVTGIGVRPVTIERVLVEIGRTTAVSPITLEAKPLELEPVKVIAHKWTLDPDHTDAGGTLSQGEYAALPGERDYKAIITILPHAIKSHRGDPVNVAGSTGLENVYFIDGMNVTSELYGETGTSLPYNFVRAVQVKTGGYQAEFGKALGAVVNAVTYSGTNEFESNVFAFLTHSDFAARAKDEPTLREAGALSYDLGGRISGPVLRDRLWYSAAYNPRMERVNREITGHGAFTDRRSAHVFAAKMTWRATSATNVELSLFGDPTVHEIVAVPPRAPAGYALLNPDPYFSRFESGGTVSSLRARGTLGDGVLLEGSIARHAGRRNTEGANELARAEPLYVDDAASAIGGGLGLLESSDARRVAATIRATLTLGRHTATLGGEYEDVAVRVGGDVSVVNRLSDSTYVWQQEYAGGGTNHNRVPTAYIQDSWRVSEKFTLNLGLRWSEQRLIGASGDVAQSLRHEWQPRVGAVWQPGRHGTQRVFASYGRYYQQEPLFLTSLFYQPYSAVFSTYVTDPRQPGAVATSMDTVQTGESDSPRNARGLQAENFDEFTLGYERLLGQSGRVGARVIRRNLRSSMQWGWPTGSSLTVGTPGEGDFSYLPRPRREYTGLEITADGMWRQLSYRTSYVLSRTWGNYSGLYGSDLRVALPGGIATFMAPHQAANSTGFLPNDHTHVLKLSGSFRWGFGLATGAIFSFESGSPLNSFAYAPAPWPPPLYTFVVPRGSAGRTPSVWNLDLRFAYEQTLRGRTRARLLLDILQVGNPQRTVGAEEVLYRANDNGIYSNPNPSYGVPVAFQRPMMGRLGLELSM